MSVQPASPQAQQNLADALFSNAPARSYIHSRPWSAHTPDSLPRRRCHHAPSSPSCSQQMVRVRPPQAHKNLADAWFPNAPARSEAIGIGPVHSIMPMAWCRASNGPSRPHQMVRVRPSQAQKNLTDARFPSAPARLPVTSKLQPPDSTWDFPRGQASSVPSWLPQMTPVHPFQAHKNLAGAPIQSAPTRSDVRSRTMSTHCLDSTMPRMRCLVLPRPIGPRLTRAATAGGDA